MTATARQWIQSYTGKSFTPLSPRAQDVSIIDIAHALSLKCRYTGHSRDFYSVAEHSVRASCVVHPAFALAALLHDAAEAYLPDVASPIKASVFVVVGGKVASFAEAESEVLRTIFEGLGIPQEYPAVHSPEVKRADLVMLSTEARDLMAPPSASWNLTQPPCIEEIIPWTSEASEVAFLKRFQCLVEAMS